MKVVFDTNIFISALALRGSRAKEAMLRILDGRDELIVSRALIDETLAVLARKFSKDREALSRVAVLLSEMGQMVEPTLTLTVLADEPDNRVLECALAGQARCIVTGDRAMLELGEYEGIRILSLRAYLEEH